MCGDDTCGTRPCGAGFECAFKYENAKLVSKCVAQETSTKATEDGHDLGNVFDICGLASQSKMARGGTIESSAGTGKLTVCWELVDGVGYKFWMTTTERYALWRP